MQRKTTKAKLDLTQRFVLPKPIPSDDHIFENLVSDVMARRLNCRNMQRYGRSGQKQDGVDIAGVTKVGVIGIQCKHHPKSKIPLTEIDETITDADQFNPPLVELHIITSADRDVEAHGYVLGIDIARRQQNNFPVTITFWEELVDWLDDYPDLVFKYFTQFFPISRLEDVRIPISGEARKETHTWQTEADNQHHLKNKIRATLGDISVVDPYQLSIGISTFADTRFDELVDLQLLIANYFEDETDAAASFEALTATLYEVKALFNDVFYNREVWLYLNVRLSLAYLIGWVFRRVSRADNTSLKLIANSQVWASEGLPVVATRLTDHIPEVLNAESTEVAIVLNISRETDERVREFVKSWGCQPRALLVWDLDTHEVRSAAHALSLAQEISRKLKVLMDNGNVSHIHLFGALPAALATLIGYHLNAIQPISLYFLDSSRQRYLLGGTLHNNL